MSKSSKLYTAVCRYASAVLMLVLLVFQFLPFWNVKEIGKVSISQYIWFPYKYTEMQEYIKDAIGNAEYTINDSVLVPVLILVLCVVGIVYCLISKKVLYTAFPIACGVVGIVGYLLRPEFQLGANWMLHLVPCALMVLVGAAGVVFKLQEMKAE